jgi:hypothetical protein
MLARDVLVGERANDREGMLSRSLEQRECSTNSVGGVLVAR